MAPNFFDRVPLCFLRPRSSMRICLLSCLLLLQSETKTTNYIRPSLRCFDRVWKNSSFTIGFERAMTLNGSNVRCQVVVILVPACLKTDSIRSKFHLFQTNSAEKFGSMSGSLFPSFRMTECHSHAPSTSWNCGSDL